jgi:hypothetical protein
MDSADHIIRDALKKAQAILAQYLQPDGPNEKQTVKQLFGILDDPAVVQALQQAKQQPAKNPKPKG